MQFFTQKMLKSRARYVIMKTIKGICLHEKAESRLCRHNMGENMSEELHLPNKAQREHYIPSKSKPLRFNTRVLYAGKLQRTKQWAENYHKHDFLEVIFVTSGTGHIKIDDNLYVVKKGDVIVYPSDAFHSEYTNGNKPIELMFFATSGLKINHLPENHLLPEGHNPVIQTEKDFGRFNYLFDALLKETQNSSVPYSEMMADFYVKILLTEILRKTEINETALVKNAAFSEIYNYINDNYTTIRSIEDICEKLYVNKYYVSHIFKKYTGFSPMQYVTRCRMTLAKNLLEETDLSINEIAEKCGYEDVINFFRNFKKSENTSPLAYRLASTETDKKNN